MLNVNQAMFFLPSFVRTPGCSSSAVSIVHHAAPLPGMSTRGLNCWPPFFLTTSHLMDPIRAECQPGFFSDVFFRLHRIHFSGVGESRPAE